MIDFFSLSSFLRLSLRTLLSDSVSQFLTYHGRWCMQGDDRAHQNSNDSMRWCD
ncbi:hypothetical protein SESBI_05888 [Sesbania bispinosa]|nr:hypothetical protein SESBI_05888 [Sesbania bispinosa]